MRGVGERERRGAVVVFFVFLISSGACAHRPHQPGPNVPAPAEPPTTAALQPPPRQPTYTGPLRLYEVRVSETAGQRSILFRLSRPPEGIDYFPLRSPSRLVIDVKGPIEPLPKVRSYKATDLLVSGVRVGSYQGRMRLVIDLSAAEVPQFSVDSYETLLTAFFGEKNDSSKYAEHKAQVLFVAKEARNGPASPVVPAVDKVLSPQVKQDIHPVVADSARPETARADIPVEKVTSATGVVSPENTRSGKGHITEEPISSVPAARPATMPEEKPVQIAQASSPNDSEQHNNTAAAEEPMEIAQAPEDVHPPTPKTEEKSPRKSLREESIPSTAPAGEFRAPSEQEYTGRKISLDFKNADVHDVLRILADVSGLNIVATDDVKARVTLRLVEVPWDQALDVVLQANGLEKTRLGNVITISTTRRLEVERNARLAAKNAQQKLAQLETEYVKVNYVKATDVVALITREVQQRTIGTTGPAAAAPARAPASGAPSPGRSGSQVALMSPRGTVAADSTSNVVIIRDVRENIEAVRELIKYIDTQTPQVVIESYIVTTNNNIIRDLGVQWGYRYIASPETGNPTGVNFPGRIGLGGSGLTQGTGGVPFIADFPAAVTGGSGSAIDLLLGSLDGSQALNLRLTALETQGKARVISRPRVVTLNNKPADIEARRVVRVPVIAGNTVVGGANTSAASNAFEEFDVGITLKVTPQISSDGFVLLDIDAESSELAPASVRPSGPTSSFPLIPDELKRTASSNVLIRAGETFVLGGILQDNLRQDERGIPYLRDTPGLGWLFKGRTNTNVKDELLVFITPKLAVGTPTTGLPTAQQLWESRPREVTPPLVIQP
jgi:type IV pilus assembly protein PilQ